eukprot:6238496-Amphidinium_carterae.1
MRTVRRVAVSERADGKLLDALRGTPWSMSGHVDAVPAGPISVEPVTVDLPPPAVPEPAQRGRSSRKLHIRRDVELTTYGFTAGCAGCEMARIGGPARAHSDLCRARIETEMARDGSLRKRHQASDDRVFADASRIIKRKATAMEGTGVPSSSDVQAHEAPATPAGAAEMSPPTEQSAAASSAGPSAMSAKMEVEAEVGMRLNAVDLRPTFCHFSAYIA